MCSPTEVVDFYLTLYSSTIALLKITVTDSTKRDALLDYEKLSLKGECYSSVFTKRGDTFRKYSED